MPRLGKRLGEYRCPSAATDQIGRLRQNPRPLAATRPLPRAARTRLVGFEPHHRRSSIKAVRAAPSPRTSSVAPVPLPKGRQAQDRRCLKSALAAPYLEITELGADTRNREPGQAGREFPARGPRRWSKQTGWNGTWA